MPKSAHRSSQLHCNIDCDWAIYFRSLYCIGLIAQSNTCTDDRQLEVKFMCNRTYGIHGYQPCSLKIRGGYMTGNRQHVNHLLHDRELENFLMCSTDQYLLLSCSCRLYFYKLLNDRQFGLFKKLPAWFLQITK